MGQWGELKWDVSGSIEHFLLNCLFFVVSIYSISWYSNCGVIIQPCEIYKQACEVEFMMLTWLGQ